MTDLITERSVQFIEQNAQRPFFLEVAYNAAHWPFQVPDKPSVAPDNGRFVQPHERAHEHARRLRRRCSSAPTRASARSSARCRSADSTRNTLVIFTNDNGGEWLSRNAPLFHRKDDAVGGRHPRAADHAVAGTDPGRAHVRRRSASRWT